MFRTLLLLSFLALGACAHTPPGKGSGSLALYDNIDAAEPASGNRDWNLTSNAY